MFLTNNNTATTFVKFCSQSFAKNWHRYAVWIFEYITTSKFGFIDCPIARVAQHLNFRMTRVYILNVLNKISWKFPDNYCSFVNDRNIFCIFFILLAILCWCFTILHFCIFCDLQNYYLLTVNINVDQLHKRWAPFITMTYLLKVSRLANAENLLRWRLQIVGFMASSIAGFQKHHFWCLTWSTNTIAGLQHFVVFWSIHSQNSSQKTVFPANKNFMWVFLFYCSQSNDLCDR